MRNSFIVARRVGLVLALLLLVNAATAKKAEKTAQAGSSADAELQLVVELRDGSRIVGMPSIASVPLQTSFAKIDLPLKLVDTIEFAEDRERVKVNCANGDVLQGVLNLTSFNLTTSFGKVSVVLKDITRISGRPVGITRGRVLYYPFDEDEGSMVTDRSGSGFHGKAHGTTWTRNGAIGGAMSFNGNASIEIGDLPCVENKYAFSFGAWVYPTDYGLNGVMGKTVAGSAVFFLNTHLQPSLYTFRCDVASQDRRGERFIDVNNHMKRNKWQHLLGTYDGTQTKAYCNGVLVGKTVVNDRSPTASNEASAAIGDVAFGRGWFFHGKIDEVMIFDRCLSETEVKQIYRLRESGDASDDNNDGDR